MAVARGQHLLGKKLGSCVLERVLGYGGSSAVFLAQQLDPERQVAIKVFLPRQNMDRQMLREYYDRFLHEAESASALDHPNILPIYAYGEQDGLPYIVMPYMPGGTLAQYVAKRGPLSLSDAQWYLEQIAQALDHAHEQGLVHCDVKPANILIDDEGHAMLADFGISRSLFSAQHMEDQEGRSEVLMGTPDYISPEQAMGRAVDGRSDIYSLGVSLFYLLTKQLPFKADSTIALALLHVHETPPLPSMSRRDISPAIDRVVLQALAKSPEERFPTAGALSAAFTAALTMKTGRTRRASQRQRHIDVRETPGKANRESSLFVSGRGGRGQRHRAWLGGVVLIVLLISTIVSFSGVLITHWRDASRASLHVTATKEPVDVLPGEAPDLFTEHTQWPLSQSFFFDSTGTQYHIVNTSPQEVPLISLYQRRGFSDFRLDLEMQELRNAAPNDGGDFYGVILRADAAQAHYYLFEVLTSDIGQYIFLRYDNSANQKWTTLASGLAPMLQTGMGKKNKLHIEAQGNSFSFVLNGQALGAPIKDDLPDAASAPRRGHIGLYVEERGMEVAFSHLQVIPLAKDTQTS